MIEAVDEKKITSLFKEERSRTRSLSDARENKKFGTSFSLRYEMEAGSGVSKTTSTTATMSAKTYISRMIHFYEHVNGLEDELDWIGPNRIGDVPHSSRSDPVGVGVGVGVGVVGDRVKRHVGDVPSSNNQGQTG